MSLSPQIGAPHIGTAGWSYPHWNGVVYPKAYPPGFHPLEFLSQRFNTVEINSSFYQPLKPEITKLWMRKAEANPKFQFTAKLNQRFTHSRNLEESAIATAFRFTSENQDFLIRLQRAFHEFPLVAEMRHSSWLAEDAIGTFLDYKIGFCNIDQPDYTSAMPPTAHLTSNIGYVRLHGRNPKNSLGAFDRQAPARQRQHDYLYSQAELEEWGKRIERINRYADSTFVVFNNDAAGKSVVNALQLQSMILGHPAAAPQELRRRFPMELEGFGPRHYEQQALFSAA